MLINTLRQTILQLESNIPTSFMHVNWPLLRKTWIACVQSCTQPKDFGKAMVVLQACIKPVVFASVWHEQLGHVRLLRVTAVEREERKKIEKREKKEKEDEEERNRLAINFVKYTLGLKHSVQKQKGEEYRIHGQWGWRWLSSTRKLVVKDARTVGLRAGPEKIMVQVKDGTSIKLLAVDPGTYTFLLKKCDTDEEADKKKKDFQQGEEEISSEPPQQEWTKESDTHKRLNNLRVFRPIAHFETIDITKALTSPGRLQYPKIAKKSRLDDFLLRRSNLKVLEERKFVQMGVITKSGAEEIDKKLDSDIDVESLDEDKKSLELSASAKQSKVIDVARNILKRRKRLKEIGALFKTCYSASCRMSRDPCNCYSPLCILQRTLKTELAGLLKTAQEKVDSQTLQSALIAAGKELKFSGGKNAAFYVETFHYNNYIHNFYTVLAESLNDDFNESNKKELVKAVMMDSNSTTNIPKIEIKQEVPESCVEEEVVSMDNVVCEEEVVITDGEIKKEEEIDIENDSPKKLSTAEPGATSNGQLTGGAPSSIKTEGLLSKILSVKKGEHPNDSKSSLKTLMTRSGAVITPKQLEKVKLEDGTEVERVYSTMDTRGKIYLKKLAPNVGDRRKKRNPVKYPLYSTFLSKHNQYSLMILPKSELKKLCRSGGKLSVNGFHHLAKSNTWQWPYPNSKPLFKTCWVYRTTTIQSVPAISLQLRILWACLRWDDMQVKPQSTDGKNQVTTDTEIMTLEILKHRHLGENLEKTQYLRRKIVIPLELPKTIREVNPIRSGLRKRKREETPQNTEPQVSEEWVDEDKLELWEIKQYCEKVEKTNNMTLTRSRTGTLIPKTDMKLEVKGDAATIKAENIITKGTPEEIKEKMEMQLRAQRAAHYQKKSVETMVKTAGGQIIKLLPGQQVTADGSLVKVVTKPLVAGAGKNTLTSILTTPTTTPVNKTLIATRKIYMSKDGTAKVVTTPTTLVHKAGTGNVQQSLIKIQPQSDQQTFSIQGAVQSPQTIQLTPISQQNLQSQTLVTTTPLSQQPQRVQIIRGNDGKIQVRGLAPGQQLIQTSDCKLHVVTGQITSQGQSSVNNQATLVQTPTNSKLVRADGTTGSPAKIIVKNAQGQQVRVVTASQNLKQQLQQNFHKSIIVKQDGTKVVLSQPQQTTQNIFSGQTFTPNSVVMRGNQVIGTTNEKGQVVITSRVHNLVQRADKGQANAALTGQRSIAVTNLSNASSVVQNSSTNSVAGGVNQTESPALIQSGSVVVNNPVIAQQINEGKLQLATLNGQQVLIRTASSNSTINASAAQQGTTPGSIIVKQAGTVVRQGTTNHLQKLLSPMKTVQTSGVVTPQKSTVLVQQDTPVSSQAYTKTQVIAQQAPQKDESAEAQQTAEEVPQKQFVQQQLRQQVLRNQKSTTPKTAAPNQKILQARLQGKTDTAEPTVAESQEEVTVGGTDTQPELGQEVETSQTVAGDQKSESQTHQETQESSGQALASTVLVDHNSEIERQLLVSQPPGTVIKCVTAQVIQTTEGPRIVLQGIQGADFTPQQLNLVQQQVKQQLLKSK